MIVVPSYIIWRPILIIHINLKELPESEESSLHLEALGARPVAVQHVFTGEQPLVTRHVVVVTAPSAPLAAHLVLAPVLVPQANACRQCIMANLVTITNQTVRFPGSSHFKNHLIS